MRIPPIGGATIYRFNLSLAWSFAEPWNGAACDLASISVGSQTLSSLARTANRRLPPELSQTISSTSNALGPASGIGSKTKPATSRRVPLRVGERGQRHRAAAADEEQRIAVEKRLDQCGLIELRAGGAGIKHRLDRGAKRDAGVVLPDALDLFLLCILPYNPRNPPSSNCDNCRVETSSREEQSLRQIVRNWRAQRLILHPNSQ